jgi:hypothetical protein
MWITLLALGKEVQFSLPEALKRCWQLIDEELSSASYSLGAQPVGC